MKLSKYPSGRYGQIILPRVIRNNLAYLIDFGRTFLEPKVVRKIANKFRNAQVRLSFV